MAFRNRCSQCNAPSKYCCPRCYTYTCSATCVNDHKRKLGCDGQRNKAAYINLDNFTDLDLLNDYKFLEEAATVVDNAVRSSRKHCRPFAKYRLPLYLHRFRKQAYIRGTVLKILPSCFSKRKSNTSTYSEREKQIYWRIDWIFPQANITYTDNSMSENTKISCALEKYINPDSASADVQQQLMMYQAAGYNGIKVLFQHSNDKRFFELEISETIKSSLANKTVVEFPSFYVILSSSSEAYDIIVSD